MSEPLATAMTNTDPNSCVTVFTERLGKPWHISRAGVLFIAEWESFRSRLYDNDGAGRGGNTTIGYGHLVHVGPIDGSASEAPFLGGVTKEQAWALLLRDLVDPEKIINRRVKVPLFQYEYDALVSFVYNVRNGNDSVFDAVNSGHYRFVPGKLMQFVWAAGRQLSGLTRRRRKESDLFRDGNYDATH